MSYAPNDLLVCRVYIMARTGLSPVALGIVPDPAHGGEGYHAGWDLLSTAYGRYDYSWCESTRDNSYSNACSALDIGAFNAGGKTLRGLSTFLVEACRRGDPRAADIREIICTLDGSRVTRWDRLGRRSSGDSSHLSHTHVSFFRDSEGRRGGGSNFLGLLVEYLEGGRMAKTDDIIQRWSQGFSTTSDGEMICPVEWQIYHEKWMASVTEKLETLLGNAPGGVIDVDRLGEVIAEALKAPVSAAAQEAVAHVERLVAEVAALRADIERRSQAVSAALAA
jgi:hypothetical protein